MQKEFALSFVQNKRNNLLLFLCALFLSNVIVAEVIGVKIFSLEKTLSLPPAQISFFGFILDFNLTAGVLIWPVVFIATDIINEYFGKKGVKKISFLSAGLMSYIFIVIWSTTELPPAKFWLDLYGVDSHGNYLNINESFRYIFRQGLGIIIGSLTAFLVGQFTDVFVFHRLRKHTGSKKIWLRATGSTLVSQLVDSFVVLFIAFYIFGKMSFAQVIGIGIINYVYKFAVAVLLTPVLYIAHYLIDLYLGKDLSEKMKREAAKSKLFGK